MSGMKHGAHTCTNSTTTNNLNEVNDMPKATTCQRFVYKIKSSRLRKAKWNLTLPLPEARRNEEIISLADSQILRWLDELNKVGDADAKAREIKAKIKAIRKGPTNANNRRKIRSLYAELDRIQFKPDYVEVVFEKDKDFWRACKGFKINGVKYQRLLGTNGGVKQRTIVFLAERHIEEIRRRINNGRDENKELVPAKLEAYRALTCSASIPVSTPNGVIVVNDCETKFRADVVYVDDSNDGEPLVTPAKDQEITLDESDGYGIMLPSLAARWGRELGLDYMPSGVNTRFAWEKGMVFTFDFLEFAEKVAGKYIVKDAWGVDRDVREAELILTTSMLKLYDSYPSWEAYYENCVRNKYTFGITKACPKELESARDLNYQFIQPYTLSEEDIDVLIKPTMDEISDIIEEDWRKTILYLHGVNLNENNVESITDDWAKAIMIEPGLMNDSYVQSKVYHMIRNRINEAKIGVLKVHGNYSIVCGDPYSLCQSIFCLPVTGILKSGEVYNKYWSDRHVSDVICYRAPMSILENCVHKRINDSEDADHWYRYMTTCTLFNSWDTSANALNGMDEPPRPCRQ